LLNASGAVIARMPRPALEAGMVLVRVHYSLISTGTEVASILPPRNDGQEGESSTPQHRIAAVYLKKALRDPVKAGRRVASIARGLIAEARARRAVPPAPEPVSIDLSWSRCAAREMESVQSGLRIVTDDSEFGYQAMTREIPVRAGMIPVVSIDGRIESGKVTIGLLDEQRTQWIGSRDYDEGAFSDSLIFDPGASRSVTIVVANAGTRVPSHLCLNAVRVSLTPPLEHDLPLSELGDQGWNVGYSATGEVVGVGAGVGDIAIGDRVACAGAGKANHADYIAVPRNLVCPVPRGCDLQLAATTTVGAIALQGIRRAAPQLGETVAVIGLGLIGQLTVQMLLVSGCRVYGMDLDAARVARARTLGMTDGESTADAFKRLVYDCSGGRGADRVLVTAAAKSHAVINMAMDVARRKGTVVIVGDVGLNLQREGFYRKELDLLMSTSYGPGRYDRDYEEYGHDYPFAYVRWTMNRNMQAYMELIASGRLNVAALVDDVVAIADARQAYRRLVEQRQSAPLSILISYPEDARTLPEPADAPRISIRGHRKAPNGVIRYALVGAGAFGTSMLVPMMQRRKDRFFLSAVVSRNASAAGNFARTHQVEILASDLDAVLSDAAIDLVVIATRHHEHAIQLMQALQAGKHVFVEKPLAISWEELEAVDRCYRGLTTQPMLMVGFNRRFSPAIQTLKSILAERRSPLVVHYRLNGGYIPPDHWVQGPQGGGRNIGEACHMYDVFRSLAGSAVCSIHATPINPGGLPYLRNDNFVATLGYEDGSVANLVYQALGPKSGLSKERVEVFCDGEAYIIEDYRSLTRASDAAVLWQAEAADKGHFEELSRFGDAMASGGEPPIPFAEIAETTALSLRIEDLLTGSVEVG
jgi:predicted dehydrogenase/threonine dehydrogenase-like Zn-dependent dehydrogenase